ncbi:phosphate transporter family protein [Schaalia georgiae F0490]|uniref:Phosphate transporter family protein n=1 Tax=Schaalia georgiae F0490 TaxID=1125717 RepID=J1I0C7_9ACTO|nr:inorganic phosphate transporter [Schaalia georgiae]EJF51683.1 phosphate transporter family protein [Schaalia georgiae F0490]
MDLNLILVCVVIAVALFFSYTNGFHDAANAIATSVSTRAWTPRAALLMAAVMNVIGAMMGTAVAKTVGQGIISISRYAESTQADMQHKGLVIILAALLGACIWNLITWWFGLPSSSSHALIGGLVGAGIVSGTAVHWQGILDHVIIPMFASPIIGFVVGYFVMRCVLRLLRNAQYHRTMRRFRAAQRFSSAAMALGHGIQDAQKTMGIIIMALLAGGYGETHQIYDPLTGDMTVPIWVKVSGALAISLGTMAGGGRIMRTIGRKIIDLDPARGFTAEAVSSSILYLCSYVVHAPISTTQVVSTAIMGVGCTRRFSAVRWGVAGNIVVAWFLTLPAAAAVSAVLYWVAAWIVGV